MSNKKLFYLLLGISSIANAGVIKIRTTGQPDAYVPTMDSDNSSNLTVKGLKATTVNAPGFVPLGGMIAVTPAIDTVNSWQPPATGVIKDGFMRADGATVPSGQGSPLQGKALPNMQTGNKYPRGSTATSWVTGTYTTGGANTQASDVAVSFGSATRGTSGGAASFNKNSMNTDQISHSHGLGAGWAKMQTDEYTNSLAVDYKVKSTGSSPSEIWRHSGIVGGIGSGSHYNIAGMNNYGTELAGTTDGATGSWNSVTLSTSFTNPSFNQNTLSPSVTNNTVNNEPAYLEVVWVIRVK